MRTRLFDALCWTASLVLLWAWQAGYAVVGRRQECVFVRVMQASDATYDALIVYTALKASTDRMITLNEKHSQKMYPDLADGITTP